jgi:hypothetical protein
LKTQINLEILLEQHDVGCVLGHVGCGLNRDAHVGVVERDGVVDSVAEKADRGAERSLGLDDARLLLGGDAREDRGLPERGRELLVVEPLDLGTGERPLDLETDVLGDLLGDAVVVPGDDLDRDIQPPQAGERVACVDLRTVHEGQESNEGQAVLALGGQWRTAVGSARGDGDHATAGCELRVEHRVSF